METLHDQERIQEVESIIEELLAPTPTVIGIEGGPCGGKTTLVERIKRDAGDRAVVSLPEAASRHILALADQGIDFSKLEHGNRGLYLETEAKILSSIVANIDAAVARYAGTDAIIIADRCDVAAYVEPDEYKLVLAQVGLAESPMYTKVDQMYYLPSVARTDRNLYEQLKETNPARFESAQRAAEICLRNQAAVADHPELHVAYSHDFETTIIKIARAVLHPEDESEVKLLPQDATDISEFLGNTEHLSVHEIIQTYHRTKNQAFRLRKTTTEQGVELHNFTVKTGEGITRKEVQRRLEPSRYNLLAQVALAGAPLLKQRHHVLGQLPEDRFRAWAVDRYYDRRLAEWNLETDVEDQVEASYVINRMTGYEQATLGAEKLAKLLGAEAIHN